MISDSILKNTKHILDYANISSQTTTGNIANLNNPEYKRKQVSDISFEDELNKYNLKLTNEKHIDISSNSNINIYTEPSFGRNDKNNVNLDTEIVDLTKSNYLFKAASELVTAQYQMITDSLS